MKTEQPSDDTSAIILVYLECASFQKTLEPKQLYLYFEIFLVYFSFTESYFEKLVNFYNLAAKENFRWKKIL